MRPAFGLFKISPKAFLSSVLGDAGGCALGAPLPTFSFQPFAFCLQQPTLASAFNKPANLPIIGNENACAEQNVSVRLGADGRIACP